MTKPTQNGPARTECCDAPSDAGKRLLLSRTAQLVAGAAIGLPLASRALADSSAAVASPLASNFYPNLESLLLDTTVQHGVFATTLGFHEPGDGGGALYAVRGDFPGKPDGFGNHPAQNNLVATLQHDGHVSAEQFGATQGREASDAINGAMAFLTDWQDAQDSEPAIKLSHSSRCTVTRQIRLSRPNKKRLRNCNIDFSQSDLMVVAGGGLDAKTPAMRVSLRGYQHMGALDCQRICPGYLFRAMSGSTMIEPSAKRFVGWGMKVSGSSGNFVLIRPLANELEPTDPLYDDEANYVADAFVADNGDFAVFEGNFKWARRTCYLTPDANKVRFNDCHFVNGNVNAPKKARARQDPILIESDARRTNFFSGTYFDNGHIRDNTNKLQISGGNFVDNRRADVKQPLIRVVATKKNQQETDFRLDGLAASVGFVAGKDGNSWTTGAAGGSDAVGSDKELWRDQAQSSRASQFVGRLYKIFPGGDDPDEIIQKLWGSFKAVWRSGDRKTVAMTADPSRAEIGFEAATLRQTSPDGQDCHFALGKDGAGLRGSAGGLDLVHNPGTTINVGQLPQKPDGLTAGDLWLDGDVLKVVP